MDLGAYILINALGDYVQEVCGELPPRLRGLRLMKVETSEDFDAEDFTYAHNRQFSELCGKDYIYIHTRCGGSDGDDESNYYYFGISAHHYRYCHHDYQKKPGIGRCKRTTFRSKHAG